MASVHHHAPAAPHETKLQFPRKLNTAVKPAFIILKKCNASSVEWIVDTWLLLFA